MINPQNSADVFHLEKEKSPEVNSLKSLDNDSFQEPHQDTEVKTKISFPIWKTLGVIIATVAITVIVAGAFIIAGFMSHLLDYRSFRINPIPVEVYAQSVSYLPVGIFLAYAIPWLAKKSWKQLGLVRPTKRVILWGLGCALAMLVVVDGTGTIAERVFHLKNEEAEQFIRASNSPVYLWVFAIMGAFLAPVLEELVFRVLIFNALLQRMSLWWAAGISGFLFGAAHTSWGSLIPLMLGGMILAYAYAKTRNIWTSMIAHGTFNGLGIMAALYEISHIHHV